MDEQTDHLLKARKLHEEAMRDKDPSFVVLTGKYQCIVAFPDWDSEFAETARGFIKFLGWKITQDTIQTSWSEQMISVNGRRKGMIGVVNVHRTSDAKALWSELQNLVVRRVYNNPPPPGKVVTAYAQEEAEKRIKVMVSLPENLGQFAMQNPETWAIVTIS
jgi:hypothetical protein